MSASLLSLGDKVILPDNLLPDDTTLFYDDNGDPINEMDFDDPDEVLEERREHSHYADLALAHYNVIHGTDYKAVTVIGAGNLSRYSNGDSYIIHCGFFGAPSRDVECRSAVKHFCADLEPDTEEVFSCCIVDGKTTDCDRCDIYTTERNLDVAFGCDTRGWDKEGSTRRSWKSNIPPLPEYSRYLAEGVTLSDKAKYRLRFTLLALAYYNKKQHIDYKLVDVLPNCESYEDSLEVVAHCNFIARQSARADASNRLFFAELVKSEDDWVVTACRVVRGKTTAGCHNCPRHRGKRVIHPTRGFPFGLYPGGVGPRPRLRLRRR